MRWRARMLALALAANLAQDAAAQEGAPGAGPVRAELLAKVEAAGARANRDGATASERAAALERAMAARVELLGALPEDIHRPIWLLDQAADELAQLTLSLDDARLVVGLPSRAERARTLRAARSAYGLADQAGQAIEARFERQRAILEAGGELAPGDRTLNRLLAETEMAVRRPLLMGRAMALLVAGRAEDAQPAEAATLLNGLRVGSGEAAALRDTALAIALVHQDGRRQEGLERLEGVLSAQPMPAGSRVHAEASLLRQRLRRGVDAQARAIADAAGRPPFVDRAGRFDPALLVLATEARARVLAEGGRLEPAARALMGLADRLELDGSRDQRAALADARLAALAQAEYDWSTVAPDVSLRAARALVGQDRPELDDRAIALLEVLLERLEQERDAAIALGEPDPAAPERGAAMELLARLWLSSAGRLTDDAQTQTQTQAQAQRARALALVHALLALPSINRDGLLPPAASLALGPAGRALEPQQRADILAAAIEHAPAHPAADRWRLGLAAQYLAANERWDRALALARATLDSDDARTRADGIALAGAAHTILVERRGDTAGSLETLQEALEFARAHPDATDIDQDALGLRIASALIDRGRREDAVGVISALDGVPGVEAHILRARASDVLDLREQAFAAYLEASGSLRADRDGERYWLVWTRLLELLNDERQRRAAAGNAGGANAIEARIRGYLLKLRGADAQLGGNPYARRLARIESSLDR